MDEPSSWHAAEREAWEEAGVVCKFSSDLGIVQDMRPTSQMTAKKPKCLYHFFEVQVEQEAKTWPECNKRKRQWVTYAQATELLATRSELLEALRRSSLKR